MTDRIYLYDSTLRDGAQTSGIDFTVADKKRIAQKLDELGIDYIEGGWPGANPTDDAFFGGLPTLKSAQFVAFGMTRRRGVEAAEDTGLKTLLATGLAHFCIVGKSWDFHVKEALEVSFEENIQMITDSIAYLKSQKAEVFFDAEHFFDGYKANPNYALSVIKAAYEAGARWVVLCDTNGGTLPNEVEQIVAEVTAAVPGSHLGIHCHNDTGNAVANSLAAVRAGARQIQGTINGVGERCGNANLITIIPNLLLKMGFSLGMDQSRLEHLTKVSHFLDESLNRPSDPFAPYVGQAAFAHKGGLHVSAVAKDPSSYEHIDPALVGNQRNILVSDQAGRSNILARFKEIGFDISHYSKEQIAQVVEEVKKRESQGYAYDTADASFELLARGILHDVPEFFTLERFRVMDERRWNVQGELVTFSEATVRIEVEGRKRMSVAEGNGPVNALDKALRGALMETYPQLTHMRLTDYKVRIIDSGDGTKATTRVLIESADDQNNRWITIGVSPNIIDASYNALHDSVTYFLMR